jgi:DNA-binding response OmpR family regulator
MRLTTKVNLWWHSGSASIIFPGGAWKGERSDMAKSKLDFQNVGMVLGDGNAMIRQGIKGALFNQGFREIIDTDKTSVAREMIKDTAVDILITDYRLPDGDALQLVHDIRHHRCGSNPFMVIITLIDAPEKEVVMKVMDSGSDDIIIKPISAGKLLERITMLARDRKLFVVTTDYIGPDRRAGHRAGTMDIPKIEVPNPVKAKVEGDTNTEALQSAVDAVARVVNEQKMERHAFQIDYLVNIILPMYEGGKVTPEVVPHLDRLLYVAQDISRRLEGTPFAHVGELCQSMVAVTEGVRKKPTSPMDQDLKLMPQLAKAIKRAFEPTEDSAALARDISDSVSRRSK